MEDEKNVFQMLAELLQALKEGRELMNNNLDTKISECENFKNGNK